MGLDVPKTGPFGGRDASKRRHLVKGDSINLLRGHGELATTEPLRIGGLPDVHP